MRCRNSYQGGAEAQRMAEGEILGTTTVSDRWRISLIKAVREAFEEENDNISLGDRVVYRRVGGSIVIEPA